jgi:hypothetical protein
VAATTAALNGGQLRAVAGVKRAVSRTCSGVGGGSRGTGCLKAVGSIAFRDGAFMGQRDPKSEPSLIGCAAGRVGFAPKLAAMRFDLGVPQPPSSRATPPFRPSYGRASSTEKSSGWWLKAVAAPAAFGVTQPSFDLRRQQHDTIITSIMPKPDFRLVVKPSRLQPVMDAPRS